MTSEYKYVAYKANRYGKKGWEVKIPNCPVRFFTTEREAAIAVDKEFIKLGKEPVNILKRK
jgi:hypothetical protein